MLDVAENSGPMQQNSWMRLCSWMRPCSWMRFIFHDAWFNDAVADYNLKNYEAAEKSVREELKLDPPSTKIHQSYYLLGIVLAARKDYGSAVEQLRVYLKVAPDAPDAARAKTQIPDLEKLRDSNQH